jgi:hypothetical protein
LSHETICSNGIQGVIRRPGARERGRGPNDARSYHRTEPIFSFALPDDAVHHDALVGNAGDRDAVHEHEPQCDDACPEHVDAESVDALDALRRRDVGDDVDDDSRAEHALVGDVDDAEPVDHAAAELGRGGGAAESGGGWVLAQHVRGPGTDAEHARDSGFPYGDGDAVSWEHDPHGRRVEHDLDGQRDGAGSVVVLVSAAT